MAKKSIETRASESPKLCQCRREARHLNSMQLMLMESLADKRTKATKFYKESTQDALIDLGKCAKVDMSRPVADLEKIDKYVSKGEIRPVMRVLQDTFWIALNNTCVSKKDRV